LSYSSLRRTINEIARTDMNIVGDVSCGFVDRLAGPRYESRRR
jgi:hypothetical protein